MKNVFLAMTVLIFLAGCGSSDQQSGAQSTTPAAQSQMMAAANSGMNPNIATGVSYLHQGDIKSAIKSFDAAIRENPKDVQGYLVLGQTYMHMKEYSRAIDTFTVATRVSPENGEAHYLLATNLGLSGNFDSAKLEAQRCAEIFRDQKDATNFKRAVALLQSIPTKTATK